ncbi:MAG: hypothetical protein CMJ52_07060 [Planctomycetaceae bacterium]|nr:hypothetical protein [Planctomycetaceae bacterium]
MIRNAGILALAITGLALAGPRQSGPPSARSGEDLVTQPAIDANDDDPNDGVRSAPRVASRTGVTAVLSTLDAPPPGFDGKSRILLIPGRGLEGWKGVEGEGDLDGWKVDDEGNLLAGPRDIRTERSYRDFQLHFEYSLPRTPGRVGVHAASTRIRVHDRFRIEFRNDYGRPARSSGTGSVLEHATPLVNAALPAPGWQPVDIYFRGPRLDGGVVTEPARITMMVNGVLVQNNVSLTGASDGDDPPADSGAIVFEGGDLPVYFRNIWIRPS